MTLEDAIIEGKKYAHSIHVKLILSDLLGYNPLELYLHLKEELDDAVVKKYISLLDNLKNNKPLQYVMGNVDFYGFNFLINEKVLIPRFETEELVENTLKYIDQFENKKLKVIDLGCGSGVIGLTLKKLRPSLEVTLLDISLDALDVAKKNADRLGVLVNFIHGDMLEGINDKFDVIVSNPPYISKNDKVDSIVLENEPHLALFALEDGLEFYKKILKKAPSNLNVPFLMAFEIGESQKEKVTDIILENFNDVIIDVKKDLQGRNRMVFVTKKDE